MFIAAHEWSRSKSGPAVETNDAAVRLCSIPKDGELAAMYKRLSRAAPDMGLQAEAANFLHAKLASGQIAPCDLPETPHELEAWMHAHAQLTKADYGNYLGERKAGAPRRYFTNRAHALYFLRAVAPTKLVDGAWLYGLVKHWQNPNFSNLIRTYVEELGDGIANKNHVAIYRRLLSRYGIDQTEGLEDCMYTQGLIQLALAFNAEHFLPEVIGFNLGYEQLPLHLLITAYELNELGIDPYYFTLHVTVDNAATGHARRAVQAALDTMPSFCNSREFWRRIRAGYQLGNAGIGTCQVIEGFDIQEEVVRIFSLKSVEGHGVHSDYCRIAGRNVNDWLANAEDVPAFLFSLRKAGWIKLGEPVKNSRFWNLLEGGRAEMFGVFTRYELQVIHDWIRGNASVDGRAYTEPENAIPTRHDFRAEVRLAVARGEILPGSEQCDRLFDSDLHALNQQLATADDTGRASLLVAAMAPSQHWTAAGLRATRLFCELLR